jgi:hypothetical protein
VAKIKDNQEDMPLNVVKNHFVFFSHKLIFLLSILIILKKSNRISEAKLHQIRFSTDAGWTIIPDDCFSSGGQFAL